jgi:uncharacterized membrane protein YoaK (UPF0700 family)
MTRPRELLAVCLLSVLLGFCVGAIAATLACETDAARLSRAVRVP